MSSGGSGQQIGGGPSSVFVIVIGCAAVLALGGLVWLAAAVGADEGMKIPHGQIIQIPQEEYGVSSEEADSITDNGTAKWKSYSNEAYGYEVEYPGAWEVIEAKPKVANKAVWAVKVLVEPELQKVTFFEKEYRFWPGEFQIRVMSNPNHLSLEEWIRLHEPQDITGGSLVQSMSDTDLDGQTAKRLSVFGFDHEEIDIISVYRGHIYHITFTGRNPNDPRLERHLEIYKKMLSAFRFTM